MPCEFVELQGVPQYCIHFCFFNFSASYRHRNSILDIFKTAYFVYIWKISIFLLFGEIWTKILAKYYRRIISRVNFFVYYSMKQFSIHELSWVLMSSHKHSCALMSTHKYGAMAQWALISANERPWPHGAMLMTSFEISWVHIAPWPQAHVC